MTQTRAPGRKAGTQGPSPRPRSRFVTLTGRGAAVALFAACFLSLLIAAWTGWDLLADVIFVMTCGLVACYTRASGLRGVVVCPPLAFLAGSVLAQLLTAPDAFSVVTGILITLVIALGRGWRPELPATGVLGSLRGVLRDLRPRDGQRVRRR